MKLACVVGARPNFVKMAPLLVALDSCGCAETTLIHTGQHYDSNLSDIFFHELDLPKPDVCLDVGPGGRGEQIARIVRRMEALLLAEQFDRVIVVGDVNSTLAASIAAAKQGIPVAHVEAGLRSFDRTMPEEINRIVTDSIADMLFVSEPSGVKNLRREGHPAANICLVGNLMIDSLHQYLPRARELDTVSRMGLRSHGYTVVTLHRPASVDDADVLSRLLAALIDVSKNMPLVFPMHPRTKRRIDEFGLGTRLEDAQGMVVLPPLGYLEFLSLTSQALCVITDSGGLQEESTALGIPCLTLREKTERPITVEHGSSTLVGLDIDQLNTCLNKVIDGNYEVGACPELWDGNAAQRITAILCDTST